MLEVIQINEELIGEDFETTVQAYLQRDIQFNLEPKKIISDALRKLGYDGHNLHFWNNMLQNANLPVDINYLQEIVEQADVEKFYRALTLDALNYLGY
jgi:hypothetical protein